MISQVRARQVLSLWVWFVNTQPAEGINNIKRQRLCGV